MYFWWEITFIWPTEALSYLFVSSPRYISKFSRKSIRSNKKCWPNSFYLPLDILVDLWKDRLFEEQQIICQTTKTFLDLVNAWHFWHCDLFISSRFATHLIESIRLSVVYSDFILAILQPNTDCFQIKKAYIVPVFCFFLFFHNLMILLGFIPKFKKHRLYPKVSNKITGVWEKLMQTAKNCAGNIIRLSRENMWHS